MASAVNIHLAPFHVCCPAPSAARERAIRTRRGQEPGRRRRQREKAAAGGGTYNGAVPGAGPSRAASGLVAATAPSTPTSSQGSRCQGRCATGSPAAPRACRPAEKPPGAPGPLRARRAGPSTRYGGSSPRNRPSASTTRLHSRRSTTPRAARPDRDPARPSVGRGPRCPRRRASRRRRAGARSRPGRRASPTRDRRPLGAPELAPCELLPDLTDALVAPRHRDALGRLRRDAQQSVRLGQSVDVSRAATIVSRRRVHRPPLGAPLSCAVKSPNPSCGSSAVRIRAMASSSVSASTSTV